MSGPAEDVVRARAAWSRLTEPGDDVAGAVVAFLGPVEALCWLREVAPAVRRDGTVDTAGLPASAAARLGAAARRWLPRLETVDPDRDLRLVDKLGGTVVVPEGPGWPGGLNDLGTTAPMCLWVRGTAPPDVLLARSVAVIGARACTSYGEHVTAELAGGVAAAGWTIVSGGAYGVDAVAHRAALACDGRTVAFLAGGVDRPYPAGNARLLRAVADGGAVVSEVPPGSVPAKVRFLQRNRLIAAASQATVVVEAAWRSGALNTAAHAAGLLRPVGAVPGPVTSAASAGCHRLLRGGAAVCVTDASEVLDLAGAVGADLAVEPEAPRRPDDGLAMELRRTLDALPVRRAAGVESLAIAAGLSEPEIRSALGRLELAGLAARVAAGWCRTFVPNDSGGLGQVARPSALFQFPAGEVRPRALFRGG